MLTTALLVRWLISIVIICLLVFAFFILLKMFKQKKIVTGFDSLSDTKKLKLVEQLYIDSKNKIIKLQDGKKLFTILVGDSNLLINEEKVKENENN